MLNIIRLLRNSNLEWYTDYNEYIRELANKFLSEYSNDDVFYMNTLSENSTYCERDHYLYDQQKFNFYVDDEKYYEKYKDFKLESDTELVVYSLYWEQENKVLLTVEDKKTISSISGKRHDGYYSPNRQSQSFLLYGDSDPAAIDNYRNNCFRDELTLKRYEFVLNALLYLPEEQKKYLKSRIYDVCGLDVSIRSMYTNEDMKKMIVDYFTADNWKERIEDLLIESIDVLWL